ncbi:hypothetical protein ACWCXE_28665 [Streptomyces sp. NPDC001780]
MTTAHNAEGWAVSVRERLGPGRLLPLGGPADGAWLAERAATAELRRAAAPVARAVLGRLRIGPDEATDEATDDEGTDGETTPGADTGAAELAVRVPPGALPYGPLRIDGEFAAVPDEPLPVLAERLRDVLVPHAVDRLGLRVRRTDLRVTALLDTPEEAEAAAREAAGSEAKVRRAADEPAEVHTTAPAAEAARLAASVAGVAHLTRTLGGPVVTTSDQVRVELATAAGHRPLDVVRAVRERLTAPGTDVTGGLPVTVLVMAVEVAS